jgi:signal transduction histidine kinase/CheY-like chemotaxis protein
MTLFGDPPERPNELAARIAKLERINAALIDRAERETEAQGNAFSMFQTTIALERQIRTRTDELTRTMRKLAAANEELRLAKEQAELADMAKTRFLAAVGHDLLQPVNAASLSASTLLELQSSEEGRKLARQVERAMTTVEGLIRTLLDMSKLEAGVVVPERSAVGLGDLLGALAADFARHAEARGLKLRMMPSSAHVDSDPVMLRRILQNLISNAIRYTSQGGVLVGVRRRAGGMVQVDVVDTGPGIPASQHDLIFEEFHRGSSAAPDEDTRLGLGLSIVRRLCAALDHPIRLRSTPGRGTVFSLTLKTVEAPPAFVSTAPPDMQGFGLTGALVAIVENDTPVREAMTMLIERWSCEVIAAASGAELSHKLRMRRRRPDLLLADYHLDNGLTGLQAVQTLRAEWSANIPALIVTGDYDKTIARRTEAEGVAVLRKPMKPAVLRAMMSHLLGG